MISSDQLLLGDGAHEHHRESGPRALRHVLGLQQLEGDVLGQATVDLALVGTHDGPHHATHVLRARCTALLDGRLNPGAGGAFVRE